jgi:hypothetical protein
MWGMTENERNEQVPSLNPHHRQAGRTSRYSRAWLFVAFAVFSVAWGGNEATPMLVFYRQEAVFSDVFVDSLLVSYAVGHHRRSVRSADRCRTASVVRR